MKHHRFFVKEDLEKVNKGITLTDHGLIHQVKDVLRLKEGDPIVLLDGSGIEFHGKINSVSKRGLNISKEKINKKLRKNKLCEVHLFASLIKKDKFEWVLQKATELGVSRITPIVSDRTEKLKLNMDRADKIVQEASEQSERPDVPFLDEPISLVEALSICETEPIILDIEGENIDVTQLRETGKVSVFVGPEGGWSEKDWKQFGQKKYQRVTLGEQVLRAETASISVCSVLLLG